MYALLRRPRIEQEKPQVKGQIPSRHTHNLVCGPLEAACRIAHQCHLLVKNSRRARCGQQYLVVNFLSIHLDVKFLFSRRTGCRLSL